MQEHHGTNRKGTQQEFGRFAARTQHKRLGPQQECKGGNATGTQQDCNRNEQQETTTATAGTRQGCNGNTKNDWGNIKSVGGMRQKLSRATTGTQQERTTATAGTQGERARNAAKRLGSQQNAWETQQGCSKNAARNDYGHTAGAQGECARDAAKTTGVAAGTCRKRSRNSAGLQQESSKKNDYGHSRHVRGNAAGWQQERSKKDWGRSRNPWETLLIKHLLQEHSTVAAGSQQQRSKNDRRRRNSAGLRQGKVTAGMQQKRQGLQQIHDVGGTQQQQGSN